MGLTVEERELSVDELLERAAKPDCEAILSGTAAVVAPVGTLIHQGQEYKIGSGEAGPISAKLRQMITEIQWGKTEDRHNWLVDIKD